MKIRFLLLFVFYTSLSHSQTLLHQFAVLRGDSVGDQFDVICNGADFNGDGYTDIAIGAPAGGYVKVYLGGINFDTIPSYIIRSDQPGSWFGGSISAGDVNGDGYDDLIVGAEYYTEGGVLTGIYKSGKVFIYFGGPTFDANPDMAIAGKGVYDQIGGSVAFVGDVDGDHHGDLLVGAVAPAAHGMIGDLWLYKGGPAFDGIADQHLQGDSTGDMFGYSIAALGDLNKDGYDDFLVGVPEGLKPKPGFGRAYLVWGGPTLSLSSSSVVYGDTSSIGFGRWTASLGDIDNDGISEIGILSATQCRIYTLRKSKFVLLDSFVVDRYQGAMQAISAGFDLNKDGYQDILVGIGDRNTQYTGSLLIYSGKKPFILGIPLQRIDGPLPNYHYALSLGIFRHLSDSLKAVVAVGEYSSAGSAQTAGRVVLYSADVLVRVEKDGPIAPRQYQLQQNYPNPFNNATIIVFSVPKRTHVKLKIFSTLGSEIVTLLDNVLEPNKYKVTWEPSHLSSGVYYCRLETSDVVQTTKLILLK